MDGGESVARVSSKIWVNEVQMLQSVSEVASTIRSFFNARSLQPQNSRMPHDALVLPAALLYGSEKMLGEKRRGQGLGLCRWTTSVVC